MLLWTNFHRYAKGGRKVVVRSIYSDDEKRLRSVVKLLNYVFFDRYHISRLTEIRPEMLSSGNAKTVNYGLLLQEHAVSPHILRHWYSVKLTLYGEDVAGLMTWRGDKSPESALTYNVLSFTRI